MTSMGKYYDEINCTPNYQDKDVQRRYLLKNVYQNAFEYKNIFLDVFREDRRLRQGKSEIKLVSIGCGAMTDYFAMQLALNALGQTDRKITYLGCDKVNWDRKFDPRKCDNVFFCHNDAAVMFQKTTKMSADLYCFPKSIRELDPVRFKSICGAFAEREIVSDKFCIAISLDDTCVKPWYDTWFIDALIKSVCSNDFTLYAQMPVSCGTDFLGQKRYELEDDMMDLAKLDARDFEYKILTFIR